MADGIDRNADDKMEFSTSKEVTVAPTFEAMHLKENLLRGIYEGIAFNHRIHCDPLVEAFSVEDIRVVGGVTQSSIWPQLFADTMGKPILIPVGGEGGALGVAMVAAVYVSQAGRLYSTLVEDEWRDFTFWLSELL